MKTSVCLFSSYVVGTKIPYYVQYYLEQLRPFFDEFIYLTNERELDQTTLEYLRNERIDLMTVKNEGYDFGMWYKAICHLEQKSGRKLNEAYHTVALVNDSCILFKNLHDDFDRIKKSSHQYIGMVISDRYALHIQSFFLVVRDEAIEILANYFHRHRIIHDYRTVIQTYEIGLSREMREHGVSIGALYNNSNKAFPKNPSFALVKDLIADGMPMIKKKIVYRNYRGLEYYWVVRMNFDTDYRKYFKIIRDKYGSATIDLDRVMEDAPRKSNFDIWLFAIARFLANFLRTIPGFRWLFHSLVDVYKKYIRKA